jgi:NAD(P)H-dependent flavin oxidoreductase YrpB (nitropropane dioxygenase family)
MGIGVSSWRLARAVSQRGQLGVVSGTLVESVLVRRLQDGDPGGHMRRAMEQFPLPDVAATVLRRYFRSRGRAAGTPYAMLPMYRQGVARGREQITMLANFVEVWLAREGHDGAVGLNLLTKLQLPTLAALYGAMLAGVGYVLMGAGIPKEIPAVLDAFAAHRPASLRLDVEGAQADRVERVTLDPADHWDGSPPLLRRPAFLAIIASNSLATMLVRKASGRVDGFVIEGPTAGGHNAPPRGAPVFNDRGEPLYGERDEVDLEKIRELGLPFWLAGGSGSPDALRQARAHGAAGIQVGTLFAYAEESGVDESFKQSVLAHAARGAVDVFTDPRASPTSYPFKVVHWPGDPVASAPEPRARLCDLGGLRVPYVQPDGRLGYRCPAEPVDAYVEKGGLVEDTVGRRCLCNALMANIGHAQVRADGRMEPPLLTSGDDLAMIGGFLNGRTAYTASDVLDYLLSGVDG